ncbi:capsule biosynthesis protein CapA [Thiocapsa imhoffii]|uniref:Capsule biosynthesis protein CapA n=1 Tax=Thiocapsa imhoffii TaxID=382777 RepID=A0A9X1B7B3_9GAMM|nr:SLBB domain-containing protein [Thiocapsa imhoffii]MBK1643669.1 capsule biosynthesis protein CapA [Thiocapsa imhoffii]
MWRISGCALLATAVLSGCGTWERVPRATPDAAAAFEVPERRIEATSFELLKQFEEAGEPLYRLGPGDEIVVDIAARPEISGSHLVGPDGFITVPFAGPVLIGDLTREQAADQVLAALEPYYFDLSVTVGIMRYGSNRIVVLGRVENPGVLQFDSPPNLLETLAQAGGLPLLRPEQLLTRCAIIRGDAILWVDLARLLTGDLSLNIRLQRNDIVYIPDSTDTPVYVLGEVQSPGVYRLTPQMSFLDALSQAGGPTRDANLNRIHVIRPADRVNFSFSFMQILQPDPSLNVALKEGDIVYVARSGVSQIGYILDNFNPFSTLLLINQLLAVNED